MQTLGIDEVGVGAIAGPACVGMVVFGHDIPHGLRDSKKLSANSRKQLAAVIKTSALFYMVQLVNIRDIELFNIRGAVNKTIETMYFEHFAHLCPLRILMDGIVPPRIPHVECFKGGDDLFPAISAASILAKVYRDNFMESLSANFPVYDWKNNVGYPTKKHIEAIKSYGICQWHRVNYVHVKGCERVYLGCG